MTEQKLQQQAGAPAVQPQMPVNDHGSSNTAIVDEEGNTVIDTSDIPDYQATAEEAATEAEVTEDEDGTDVVEVSGGRLEKTIVISDPRWLNCQYGQVAVFGHHLISEKMLNLFGACLNLPDFNPDSGDKSIPPGVFSIVVVDHPIFDKDGNQTYGLFYDNPRAVVLSVSQVWGDVEEIFLGGKNSVSVVARIQQSMLEHCLHEICHAAEYVQGIDINNDAAEERAEAFAKSAIVDLVKMIDCEPVIAEEPYFGRMLMDLIEELQPGEGEELDPHVKQCIDMIQTGTMVYLPATDDDAELRITSFKDFIKLVHKADSSDPAWSSDSPVINYVVGNSEPEKVTVGFKEYTAITKPEDVAPAFTQQQPEVETADPFDPTDLPEAPIMEESDTEATAFSAPANSHAPAQSGGIDIASLFPKPDDPVQTAPTHNPPNPEPAPAQSAPATPQGGFGPQPGFNGPAQQPQQPTQAAPQASLPQNGINEAEAQRLFILLANTLDRVFFNHCGWNGQGGFNNPKVITMQPVNLAALDPKMPEFVIAGDMEINGQYKSNRPTDGGQLYGNYKQHTGLPGYTVYLNMNGVLLRRALIPQNPNTGSNWAGQAQSGVQMTNIMDDDPTLKQSRITDKMRAQVINGQFTPFQKG